VGYEYLEYVVKNHDIPHVAIGGIKLHNVADVVRHGARCCALVSEIVGADDIAGMVARLRAEIASAR
jgi:thiamine-phosphate pyrophosphorylase